MCECIPCMWVSGEARGRWQVLWNLESSSGPPEEPDTLALHCRTSLRPPTVCFLFLNVILINCFKVLYMYTIYFGHFSPHPSLKLIPDPLLLPPNFVYSLFLKTIVHWLQCLVPIYSRMWTIHWSMANSKSHTPLKKKRNSSSPKVLDNDFSTSAGELVSHPGIVTGLILYRSYEGNSHYCESRGVQKTLFCSSPPWPLALSVFLSRLPRWSLALWGVDVLQKAHLWLSTP